MSLVIYTASAETELYLQYTDQGIKDGFQYKKAGVVITEIVPSTAIQTHLFDKTDREKHNKLTIIDKLNNGFIRNILTLAIQGQERKWKLRQELLSPSYITKLTDIHKNKTTLIHFFPSIFQCRI